MSLIDTYLVDDIISRFLLITDISVSVYMVADMYQEIAVQEMLKDTLF